MTGLLDMPLEEWLKARVAEIEISTPLPIAIPKHRLLTGN
jgi:hypothetical protein